MSLMRSYVRAKYGIYLDTSSDSDEEEKALLMFTQLYLDERLRIIRQPIPKEEQTRCVITRDRVWHDAKMMNDYFTPGTGYTSRQFKQRLGMSEDLFEKLLGKLLEVDQECHQHPDATGTMGHSLHMKLVAVMKCLCKSTPDDSVDDYTHVQRLLAENADRGFPEMLGSVDCMQWPWKNCPVAWKGTYRGKDKEISLVLEAVASYDLWFWHAFFGMPGSNNDLNVLAHSLLFDNMIKGVAPPCNYVINGHQYNMGYFLADSIYPKLTTIVQAFSQTLDITDFFRFNKYQMDKRKDVERAFGVLQGKFRIVGYPCKYWHQSDLNLIMKCCLILHNIIIEHESRDRDWGRVVPVPLPETTVNGRVFMSSLKNLELHLQLINDLVKHIAARPGRGGAAGDLSSLEDEFQQEDEHVHAYGHVGDKYEHDGDGDEDSEDEDDYDDDEDDDDEEADVEDDSDDEDAYDDASIYDDDDDVEA
ncbi:uncharacterized protein LOC113342439 [Papaver somniferum]|uniref:uncharacterized protein LOC113342439 n=1 Tax=Papaver somniferum TaxID=3469 RepID=UPI000E6F7478|nr:uncharacterized protein LOC113342439 [Papaver somniferum]